MANDFSTDSACKAVWRFESGALLADSKGTEILSNNGVTEDAVDFMEGSCSAAFTNKNLYRNDADLAAGFPLKSNDTVKTFGFTFWYKVTKTDNLYQRAIFAKTDYSNNNGLGFYVNYGNNLWAPVQIKWGNGTPENWDPVTLALNQWYHICITGDGISKGVTLRVYDPSTGIATTYTHSFSGVLSLTGCTYPFRLGAYGSAGIQMFEGRIDEFTVFNRVLTVPEIDAIRNGTFTYEPPGHYTVAVDVPIAIAAPSDSAIHYTDDAAVAIAVEDATDAYFQGVNEYICEAKVGLAVVPVVPTIKIPHEIAQVNLALTPTTETACIVFSEEAIVSFDDKDYIFIFDKNKEEGGKPFTEYRMVEVHKGVTDGGYTEIILPEGFDIQTARVVLKGAYNLLSAKKNAGEMSC